MVFNLFSVVFFKDVTSIIIDSNNLGCGNYR